MPEAKQRVKRFEGFKGKLAQAKKIIPGLSKNRAKKALVPPSKPKPLSQQNKSFANKGQSVNRNAEPKKTPAAPGVGQGAPSVRGSDQLSSQEPGSSQEIASFEDPQVLAKRVRYETEYSKINEPGGWRDINVDDLIDRIDAFTGQRTFDPVTGITNLTTQTQIGIPGFKNLIGFGTKTAVKKIATVGTIQVGTRGGIIAGGTAGVAGTIATNTLTKKATASMLVKGITATGLGAGAVKVGTTVAGVAGATMAVVGTYPFAGFLQEEGLQTLGFAIRSATENGLWDEADAAIAFQEEVLNAVKGIKDWIPFVNIIEKLELFNKSARIKMEIDKKVVALLREQDENGETKTEMFVRIEKERRETREREIIEDEERYTEIARRKAQARIDGNAADDARYARILAEREAYEAAKRKADDEYWSGIYAAIDERQSRGIFGGSSLGFGFL